MAKSDEGKKVVKEVEVDPIALRDPVEMEAMMSAWLVKLRNVVEGSPDFPMERVKEVVESMKNYLGV